MIFAKLIIILTSGEKMRKSILLITFMLAIHAQHVFGQNELFNDVVTQTQIHAQRIYRTGGLPEEIREIVIIAVDSNANSTLRVG